MKAGVTFFIYACLCLCAVQCRVTHRHIGLDERDHYPVELPFGFDKTGEIKLSVSNLAAYGPKEKMEIRLSQFAFFLAPVSATPPMHVEMKENEGGGCSLQDATNNQMTKIIDLSKWIEVNDQKEDMTVHLKFAEHEQLKPGDYVLFFANCNKTVGIECNVRISMYNRGANNEKDFLSIGERPLPTIYLFMFLAFSALAVTWAKVCYTERRHVHGIHYLMFGLVVLRSVVYFTLAGMYHDDRVTGSPEGWNVAYYVFTFLRGVMFFVVIVLIGTGWSYLRPFIGENEKKILVIVIPLQIFANIAIIILDEASPARTSFVTLSDLLHLVDIICCCAILFPIVWSIKHLREGAESDGKAASNVEKLTLFRQFYVLVVVYIYFTRIIVFLLDNTLPYNYKWASKLASELATFAFYVTVGMKFRPHGENAYLKLESDVAL